MAALLKQRDNTQDGLPSLPGREKGRCTVILAPVRSVHTDISLSKTLLLWSTIYPKTLLHKNHFVKWFSH